MRGGDFKRVGGRRRRTIVVVLLAGLVATMSVSAAADAKKKKQKKVTAVTKSAAVQLAAGTQQNGTAACTGKTHMTGGGLAVSPNFTPPSTGLRSVTVTSNPAGAKSWSTSAGAFNNPPSFGSLTTYVRCESNNAGRLVNTISSTAPSLPPGTGTTGTLNCAPGTHVISGGYAGTGITNFASPSTGYRIVILQSRRTGTGQWTVSGYNSSSAVSAASLTAYATCERNAKGVSVKEAASPASPITLNARANADASCKQRSHVVSGGFLVTPNGTGSVPGVTVDETLPSGKRGWHVGLFNLSVPPAGSALQAFAYCKKG